jgi:hypothetical protein
MLRVKAKGKAKAKAKVEVRVMPFRIREPKRTFPLIEQYIGPDRLPDNSTEEEDEAVFEEVARERRDHPMIAVQRRMFPLYFENNPRKPFLYPFRSKIKYFSQDDMKLEPRPPDFTRKPLHKLYRPYFSPQLGSWEIDIVFAPHPENKYDCVLFLFCININTKYLRVFHLGQTHTKEQIIECIERLKGEGHYVSNIRGDGEFRWVEDPAHPHPNLPPYTLPPPPLTITIGWWIG